MDLLANISLSHATRCGHQGSRWVPRAHHRGVGAAAVGALHGHGQVCAGGQLQRQVGGVRHLRARALPMSAALLGHSLSWTKAASPARV